ncbi:MAG: hypothetical protein ABI343_19190 [Burkholderiaceae bacterium]
MNQDTIPSRLNPITVPATLNRIASDGDDEQKVVLAPMVKWLLGVAAVAALMYLAR